MLVDRGLCSGGFLAVACLLAWPSPSLAKCDPADPAGPYAASNPNLGLREELGAPGCAAGMTRVADFCVDRYEGSLLERLQDGREVPWSPYHNPAGHHVRAVSIAGAVPQGYISGAQAQEACRASGKRLCTDREWLRACEGGRGELYPYGKSRYPRGSSPVHPFCNESRDKHPAVELFGKDNPFGRLKNACLNQLEKGLARSGSYSECVSEDGVFDLMGNLHEWTADPEGTFRGGFYVDTRVNGNGCRYRTVAHSFGYWDYSTGFRCCGDIN